MTILRVVLLALLCLANAGCSRDASRQERVVKDAVAAELAGSGMLLPISGETLALREEEEEEAIALLGYCLAEEVPTAGLRGLFETNARTARWNEQSRRGLSRWLKRATAGRGDAPTDYLVFSLPWIDRGGRIALIYVERRCPLCGFGKYFVLEFADSHWVIVAECDAWVS